jgi:Uma2 family endonuclease
MRAVLLEAPESLLAERRRLGLDGRDEMWEGVLHMVPPASGPHQRMGTALLRILTGPAEAQGLVTSYETGLFRAAGDYRVPDQVYSRPDQLSDRGVEGAELVVEIRSPDDETYEKLPWYAAVSVREVLVLHPQERRVELFRLVGASLLPVTTDPEGGVRSDVVGVRFHHLDGRLRLEWAGGSAEV